MYNPEQAQRSQPRQASKGSKRSQPQQASKGSKSSTPVINTGAASLLAWWTFDAVAWFALGLGAATILWVLHAPWINVGQFLVSSDGPLPLAGAVAGIPLIGGLLSGWMQSAAGWVAIVAMAAINILEVIFFLRELGYLSLKGKWDDFLTVAGVLSWTIELWVALLAHPIYLGGWAGFSADLPVPTLGRFLIGEMVSVALLMFLFECSMIGGILVILSLRQNKARSKAKAKARTTGAG